MNRLDRLLPFNHFHYYALAVFICILGISNCLFYLLFVPFFILIKPFKAKIWIILVCCCYIFYITSYETLFKSLPEGNLFLVTHKSQKDDYYTYYVKQNKNRYVFYSTTDFEIGQNLAIVYQVEEFRKERTPNGFNLKNYYGAKRIFYKLNVSDIKIAGKKPHINKYRQQIKQLFSDYPATVKSYIHLFLFNDDTFVKDFSEAKTKLGISHLFALSGLHIHFIVSFISLVLLKKSNKLSSAIIILLLVFYLWLSSFSLSLLRAVIMFVLYLLFKKRGLTELDSLSLAFLGMLIINPFYRFSLSFILSFVVSFFIVLSKREKGVKGILLIQLKAYFASLIFVINLNNGLYLFSFFSGLIYTLVFPVLILPLIFLGAIPYFSFLVEPFLQGFNETILLFPNLGFIKIANQGMVVVLIYFVLYIFFIYKDTLISYLKRGLLIVIFVFLLYLFPKLNGNGTVYFLDVGQGDTTFIQRPFDKCNILIDAHTGTVGFLNTLGDIRIDFFFITHSDYDHVSEALEVIEVFQPKNIITNPYDQTEFNTSLEKYNVSKAKSGDSLLCGDVVVEVLGPIKNYYQANNNSLVLKMNIDHKIYLFTGDIEQEAEADLILKYQHNLKCDILHVSHHGAKTATSMAFLSYARPFEAVISVGDKNLYNHPDQDTINRLKQQNVNIYLTSKQQTIIKRKYWWQFE